jgi:hypothetical protein
MGQDLSTTQNSAVPALYDPANTITNEDVILPKLKVGQYSSGLVQDEIVPAGALFTVTDAEDPEPVVLAETKDKNGVVVHVLSTPRKGWSYSDDEETGGELLRWAFDDPERHPKAWVTYTYPVLIPEADTDVPYTLLLTRSNKPTALKINTVLKRNAGSGPPWATAFRLTTQRRERGNNKWFVVQASPVEAKPEHVALAEKLVQDMTGTTADVQATGEEPEL